jgi:hypothetical protein
MNEIRFQYVRVIVSVESLLSGAWSFNVFLFFSVPNSVRYTAVESDTYLRLPYIITLLKHNAALWWLQFHKTSSSNVVLF